MDPNWMGALTEEWVSDAYTAMASKIQRRAGGKIKAPILQPGFCMVLVCFLYVVCLVF